MLKVGTLAAAARASRPTPQKIAWSVWPPSDHQWSESHRRFVPTVNVPAPEPKPWCGPSHLGERRSRRVQAGGHGR